MSCYCNIAEYLQVRHETLRISVISRMEKYLGLLPSGEVYPQSVLVDSDSDTESPTLADLVAFEPFKDLYKRRFLWYYESYLTTIQRAAKETRDETPFKITAFEHAGNEMSGKFNYKDLERRLKLLKKALDDETERWAIEGKQSLDRQSQVSDLLMRLFHQTVEEFKTQNKVTLDISIINSNPFLWDLTYFGRPMTNLDGGLFKILMYFSPRFPEEQPRVKFVTKMFHHRIALDGTLCYYAERADSPRSHVEGIIDAIEDSEPPYDPRTLVNLEASKLFWGTEADRKIYHRRLRRAAQSSLE